VVAASMTKGQAVDHAERVLPFIPAGRTFADMKH
jgi:hypothetical protein